MMQPRPRVLTGLRANNDLTIGNYLGAVLPMVNLMKKHKDTHDFFMFVPDLHSFTTPIDHSQLYESVINNVKFYIAAGAVTKHTTVYRQSFIPAHSELTWILDCFTGMGEMGRMTQFKEKAAKRSMRLETMIDQITDENNEEKLAKLRTAKIEEEEIQSHAGDLNHLKKLLAEKSIIENPSVSVGLFNYPVLMAADILLYHATYVPVGDDQTQHLEFTRDIAERMNARFNNLFTVPL
ncbi:MAG TPA: hypothetical protein VFT87_02465, partial [Candidatus Saccharimonadales bacterium]|nr:hypothetical protein [Candidatus Saccharimonadales bacterium]